MIHNNNNNASNLTQHAANPPISTIEERDSGVSEPAPSRSTARPPAQLKKLRTALAVSRGTTLLSMLQREAEATVSHDQSKRFTYLTLLFSRIHREMFHDWREQATVSHRPGAMNDPGKRKQFRKAIERLVLDDDPDKRSAIFDNNGFVIEASDIAARLAGFYQEMRRIRPFGYGNQITLDFFMIALGTLPAFRAVYQQGIDFRRLTATDTAALHATGSGLAAITQAFEHAFDPGRNKSLPNSANAYGKWPENKKSVFGIPFLSHKTAEGTECLVTVNGGLVPLDRIKREPFGSGQHFADYPPVPTEQLIGYLPDTAALRAPDKTDIDGIAIEANGAAPLFCLDLNILTGLRTPSHAEWLELLQQCTGNRNDLMQLPGNGSLKNKLLAAADCDKRLQRSVEIAFARLGKIKAKLDTALDRLFQGKTPDPEPKLFMCMGGAGSGKTAVEELARARCGENFVVASLDEFRKMSDLYAILTAADHHSDDYVYVEPFANKLRDMVAERARSRRINLLYDGTGIPYQPRYHNIIEQFAASGFQTQISAVDAFIIKPKGRENELLRSGALGSVKHRFETTGRALPWVITVYKHVQAPRAFLMALEHPALTKISLFANDGERGRHYLVAESFDLSDHEVDALQLHQLAGTLAAHFKNRIRMQSSSVLKALAGNDEIELTALIERNPDFGESNVAYLVYPGRDRSRVLAIYNTRRMVDFMQKRQLNPNASGEQGLLHKPDALAFHVDPLADKPWLIRLQDA